MNRETLKKIFWFVRYFTNVSFRILHVLWVLRSSGHLKGLLKILGSFFRNSLMALEGFPVAATHFARLDSPNLLKLRNRARGLHSLLPNGEEFSYSILIPVYRPKPEFFRKALQSAIYQSAPHLEVILGLDGEQPDEVLRVIEEVKQELEASCSSAQMRVVPIDRSQSTGGISKTTNALAKLAQGRFLLLMDHDDWIRPDLLYRYEQCLRLHQEVNRVVLYCDEYKINEKDEPIHSSFRKKPEKPVFPFLFINSICHCLLVPKGFWEKVGGLRSECDGAQDLDLCLRLDLAGAVFQIVPLFLYAWRAHSSSTAQSSDTKDYASPAGVRALTEYLSKKGLDWKVSEGYFKTSYRAIPPLNPQLSVQIVIPYRNQKEVTLKAVASVMKQKGVRFAITAVDNQSDDRSIGEELQKMGVEVLRVDEPFNFSRLNNLAVKKTKLAVDSNAVLFLNNDVELAEGALEEMGRWVDQPQVGMVGARLSYPNGLLQHGGVQLQMAEDPYFQIVARAIGDHSHRMVWKHRDALLPFEKLGEGRVINICDAVTGACLMMRKDVFLKVGGFDEIWYPVGYSDTDLAMRVRRLGLYALYTPFAEGIHYESLSRGVGIYEDMEASYWLFRNTESVGQPPEKLKHQVFLDSP